MTLRTVLGVVLLASLVMNILLYQRIAESRRAHQQWSTSVGQVEVMRTKGGLLQVSTIRSPEYFRAVQPHDILGFDLGPTTTHIRVPATYHYHIRLAEAWRVRILPDRSVVVIAPPVQPTLPVAIDTAALERQAEGRWSLLTGAGQLDALQRSITATLSQRAASPSYIDFQRDAARKTIAEFVHDWLLTQEQWKDIRSASIKVAFQDEPIKALPDPAVQELLAN